ncbi:MULTISPECIES: poly-beta-1,6-N-acetyl-D-glucosamine N-deacetylase PgaB [Variovorax]|jgi:poly-beta-1,6-N-acetyl-D-glucosamine N-deacetylase|uniref:poly-beta-1,6-N-acetyl-D-glucosamine N-deacetylase PgaB n=2 Tax=Comamonadaceae TaxID=80864 RepID=UPI00086BAB01|nr:MULTISPECIES: poly-beta-1,6-N-acetyl-D-glucosamine N-deacetylase PgaB [Variovorax]MBN8757461.1 poly-beta-1,6-N-acetyl-D-glucosamine N-deacetylase PgaB [Variovorax sp.]ODU12468.1 MAG: poly-beta-1,6-N-acetyl-D-glucosamine N-deacetylase PgaB [Variovorax sp. SCN 67-85]OJZ07033.1 MAG: poly-beta-1,6-N-acetyl-D-glucosamine N-deacetylase PgaB [Variovorax sp. 67-131]ODV16915.1 MAG: poly-beta-1,6-N-acetyl-D-glucosamine N-deacetylase PgaB [Variovorax sp. SCN 67-20]UKI09455.1 poly-beta-1,6-N-acetyl-D-g
MRTTDDNPMTFLRAAMLWLVLAAASALALPAFAQPLPPADPDDGLSFRVLSFHDVRTGVRASFEQSPDETAIDDSTLAEVFAWLQFSGYHPVSLQQIVDARAGGKPLPARPVLLTFDDGYRSAYTKVFPLLKRYNYPALFALVTSWLDVPEGQLVHWGDKPAPRENFLLWPEVAEMARSGLAEFASHTDAMHTGILANPQGNMLPAAATHRYDPKTGRYEDDDAYVRRVEADLRRSREIIEARTGARVRATVWPYGAYNTAALEASARAGMPITFTLDDGANSPDVPLTRIRRALAAYDNKAPEYAQLLRNPVGGEVRQVNRVMHVDLDYVYDPDPAQQERNLSALIDRVAAVRPRSVFLQAYADPDGDGVANALYFPNRHLPMRADLFGRAAWQLRTRTGVKVYAWMPVTAFRLPASNPLATHTVMAQGGKMPADRYHRLTPFDPAVRTLVGDIYEDLGRYTFFEGVLFHDDATLSDDEDASPSALATYAKWGLPPDVAAIRADPALMARWTAAKTRYLIDFTHELAARLGAWRPALETARNLYARPVLEPQAEQWFAQNYEASLAAYDYVALMAMPRMEQEADADAWLGRLARRAADTPRGLDGTVFELQARDWRTGKPVADAELARQWTLLQRAGVRHLGYYPDDFLNNQPSLDVVRRAISVRTMLPRALGASAAETTPPQGERAP